MHNVTITIVNYPPRFTFFALLAMAVFRIPMFFNRRLLFYKLMGTGKNGGFSKQPDWQQWVILAVHKGRQDDLSTKILFGFFVQKWLTLFRCTCCTILLNTIKTHGTWDAQQPFVAVAQNSSGQVAVLTRATLRWKSIRPFWRFVPEVRRSLQEAKGLYYALSMGEIPFRKQATLSIWENEEAFKQFAYQNLAHKSVVHTTRKDNWYKEDLFARFNIVSMAGKLPDWTV